MSANQQANQQRNKGINRVADYLEMNDKSKEKASHVQKNDTREYSYKPIDYSAVLNTPISILMAYERDYNLWKRRVQRRTQRITMTEFISILRTFRGSRSESKRRS